ncbi:GM26686 [Drosophila sechellia]|uniref:GM26686 n=1 Tax=Drosophila sechellia TaxID=7238 RepID=B4IN97_DROSE|nr:GM26686 [Drosophila sechellia]
MALKWQLTAPYTPQENSTERAKRTVKTMIAQFTGADQRTWDEHWPELQLAVNTSVAETTEYLPAFITRKRAEAAQCVVRRTDDWDCQVHTDAVGERGEIEGNLRAGSEKHGDGGAGSGAPL